MEWTVSRWTVLKASASDVHVRLTATVPLKRFPYTLLAATCTAVVSQAVQV